MASSAGLTGMKFRGKEQHGAPCNAKGVCLWQDLEDPGGPQLRSCERYAPALSECITRYLRYARPHLKTAPERPMLPPRRNRRKSSTSPWWCWKPAVAASIGFVTPHVTAFVPHVTTCHLLQRGDLGSASTATTTITALSAAPPPQHSSAAAQTVHSVFLESLVSETNTESPVRSVEEAKNELLQRVGFGTLPPGAERSRSDEDRVGYLLKLLEESYTPILTVGFFNFAAQGDWDLAYTNAAMPPIGPRLKVYKQFQRIEPEDGAKGNLTNILAWRLLDEAIDGRLEVGCGYELDPRGRMNVSLLKHRLLPVGKMPRDPKQLVGLLRRAMPHELFDPDGHAMETTFLDDTLRILRVRGPVLEGRVDIFARRARNVVAADAVDETVGVQATAEESDDACVATEADKLA